MTNNIVICANADQPIPNHVRHRLGSRFYVGSRQITVSAASRELITILESTLKSESIKLRGFMLSLATYLPREWVQNRTKHVAFVLIPGGDEFIVCTNPQQDFERWLGPVCSGRVSKSKALKIKTNPKHDFCETVGGDYLFSARLANLLAKTWNAKSQEIQCDGSAATHVRLIPNSISRVLSENCITRTVPCSSCGNPFQCELGIWMAAESSRMEGSTRQNDYSIGHGEYPIVVSSDVAQEIIAQSFSCMLAPVFLEQSEEALLANSARNALSKYVAT